MTSKYANVVVPTPIDKIFTYSIPDPLRDAVQPGVRVWVPFGKRKITGYVVGLVSESPIPKLKEIEDVLDETPTFSAELLTFCHWISDYYFCSWGEVLKAAHPPGINLASARKIHLSPMTREITPDQLAEKAKTQWQVIRALQKGSPLSFHALKKKVRTSSLYSTVFELAKKNLVTIEQEIPLAKIKRKTERWVIPVEEIPVETVQSDLTRFPKQLALFQFVSNYPNGLPLSEVSAQTGASNSVINSLVKRGWLRIEDKERIRKFHSDYISLENVAFELTGEQKEAIGEVRRKIEEKTFHPFLLHGITGSGKTQVYIECIRQVLETGRQALVLIPEISLTPQTVARFQLHFRDSVAVLHSQLSEGERYDTWRKIKEGNYKIVIGPRSAIFSPLSQLGLIVVDEEHEDSYKQFEPAPRYHARDAALVRAKANHAVVVLGTATPSLETYYNASRKKYTLLQLTKRVEDIPLPPVKVVDLKITRPSERETQRSASKKNLPEKYLPVNRKQKGPRIFTDELKKAIAEKLEKHEQIILLQNRRGFSTCIECFQCGYTAKCPNCSITLTFHQKGHKLRCHYCGHAENAPTICPDCGNTDILFRGIGTQRVEEELKKFFPEAKIVRMDMDTTRRKGAHDRILSDFQARRYDILLGTQMVAKGLDFPAVTLVGVINADTSLLLPDFRAAEKTFQLLLQVAGRSGRSWRLGEVILQTYSPDHYAIEAARGHNFLMFYETEMENRKALWYPPFGRLVKLEFKGENENQVKQIAQKYRETLDKEKIEAIQILGPAPAPLSQLKKQYRYHIIIKQNRTTDPSAKFVHSYLTRVLEEVRKRIRAPKIKIFIDMDAQALL